MAYAVMNIRKNKGNAGALGAHIDRAPEHEHMYQNANPELKHHNVKFELTEFCKMPLPKAIDARIKQGYKGKKAIRKDAVKSLSLVLTGSHQRMKEIFTDEKIRLNWIAESIHFVQQEFGEENIVRMDLHLDEKTPHIHAVVVPLTADGRLSAKEKMGNKKHLKEMLSRYAAKMEKYGLQRGLERSAKEKPKATTLQEFYKAIEQADEITQKIDFKAIKSISPKDKTILLQKLLKGANFSLELDKLTKRKGQKL